VAGLPASGCLADETIVALLGRQLSAVQLQAAERHLASCAECRQILADAAYGALDSQPQQPDESREHARVAHEAPPAPGQVLSGKYRLERLIGRGGMGVLYEARQLELGQRVAIKLMQDCGSQAAVRFLREARISARLSGPAFPRIYDLGRQPGGAPYLVLELLEGEDLARTLARGPLPLATALDYLQQLCEALREPHAAGIVHRDLKPANLFLVPRRAGPAQLKILDFGISKQLTEAGGEPGLTATHSLLGSPLYMSPEQLADSKSVDLRTDIWALGVIAYQLLSGQLPFVASSLPALCAAISHAVPVPPSRLRPELPAALDALLLQCLEKRPEDRIASVEELSLGLAALSAPGMGDTAARPSPLTARRSLAVLGFEELSAPGQESWLSTALVQLFAAALMSQPELRLVALERVAQTRRELGLGVLSYVRPDALRQLDLALRVDLVLLGSFLRQPEQRLKLQLLVKSTRDGETLVSAIEEGHESNLYEMTERAAARVRLRLGLELPAAAERQNAQRRLPADEVAARHYAEGLLELYRQRPARALPLLVTAAELAPAAPLVHIALARAADAAGRDSARAPAPSARGRWPVCSGERRAWRWRRSTTPRCGNGRRPSRSTRRCSRCTRTSSTMACSWRGCRCTPASPRPRWARSRSCTRCRRSLPVTRASTWKRRAPPMACRTIAAAWPPHSAPRPAAARARTGRWWRARNTSWASRTCTLAMRSWA
jgi:serine/threonine protein kinase